MGVRILYDKDNDLAALYCSTNDVAFGPIFSDAVIHDAQECAEAFLRFVATTPSWSKYEIVADLGTRDVRLLTEAGIAQAHSEWLAQRDAQWAAEEAQERAALEAEG